MRKCVSYGETFLKLKPVVSAEINACCAVHDSCYDNLVGGQKNCDSYFCRCLNVNPDRIDPSNRVSLFRKPCTIQNHMVVRNYSLAPLVVLLKNSEDTFMERKTTMSVLSFHIIQLWMLLPVGSTTNYTKVVGDSEVSFQSDSSTILLFQNH